MLGGCSGFFPRVDFYIELFKDVFFGVSGVVCLVIVFELVIAMTCYLG